MTDENDKAGWAPNKSTGGSALGAAIGMCVAAGMDNFHIPCSPTFASAIVGLFTILGGYLPQEGRK